MYVQLRTRIGCLQAREAIIRINAAGNPLACLASMMPRGRRTSRKFPDVLNLHIFVFCWRLHFVPCSMTVRETGFCLWLNHPDYILPACLDPVLLLAVRNRLYLGHTDDRPVPAMNL
jgi:hypothetical protein